MPSIFIQTPTEVPGQEQIHQPTRLKINDRMEPCPKATDVSKVRFSTFATWFWPVCFGWGPKWRFRLRSPTKNVLLILVVTVTGMGPHPIVCIKFMFVLKDASIYECFNQSSLFDPCRNTHGISKNQLCKNNLNLFFLLNFPRLQICPLYIFGNKATDGTKPDLHISFQGLALIFRAKSTTLFSHS